MLAPLFGAARRPPITLYCWEKLLDLMSGCADGAKLYKINSWSSAKTFCTSVNVDLTRIAQPEAFDMYDLSCCICLTLGRKHTYHVEQGKPFEVRLARPCIDAVQSSHTLNEGGPANGFTKCRAQSDTANELGGAKKRKMPSRGEPQVARTRI